MQNKIYKHYRILNVFTYGLGHQKTLENLDPENNKYLINLSE